MQMKESLKRRKQKQIKEYQGDLDVFFDLRHQVENRKEQTLVALEIRKCKNTIRKLRHEINQ